MVRTATMKYIAAGSVALPCAAVFIWPNYNWLVLFLLLWMAGASVFWIVVERREHKQRLARAVDSMHGLASRTLNHHRHDWMNDLQVLYGYIRMQKQDKCIEYVEKIRERMAVESSISRLGIPSLISFIQSFRTVTNTLELKVTIHGELHFNEYAMDHERIAQTIIQTINAYRFAVKPDIGNPAVLRLELWKDEAAVYAAFDYEGELINVEQWDQKIQEQLEGAPWHLDSGKRPGKASLQLKAITSA